MATMTRRAKARIRVQSTPPPPWSCPFPKALALRMALLQRLPSLPPQQALAVTSSLVPRWAAPHEAGLAPELGARMTHAPLLGQPVAVVQVPVAQLGPVAAHLAALQIPLWLHLGTCAHRVCVVVVLLHLQLGLVTVYTHCVLRCVCRSGASRKLRRRGSLLKRGSALSTCYWCGLHTHSLLQPAVIHHPVCCCAPQH